MKIFCNSEGINFSDINDKIKYLYLESKHCVKKIKIKDNNAIVFANDLDYVSHNEVCFIELFISYYDTPFKKHPLQMNNSITFCGRTEVQGEEHLYSCYVGHKGVIRIYNEGFISNKTALNDVKITQFNTSNNDFINVTVDLKTNYIKPILFNIYIRDRKVKKQFKIQSDDIATHIIDNEKMIYQNIVHIKIHKSVLANFISGIFDPQFNHFNRLDLYYNFEVSQYTASSYEFRLPIDDIKEIGNQFTISVNNKVQLFTLVKTKFDNFTLDYYQYNADVFKYFEELPSKKECNKKPIILITELPYTARDNGLAIFKNLIKTYQNIFDIYYIIQKDSYDTIRLSEYQDNIIYSESVEHCDIFIKSDIILHSHSSIYILPVSTNRALQLLKKKVRYFIQHGVIGQKDVSNIYSYNDATFTDFVIVSSSREATLLHNDYGFPEDSILNFGLPRFDNLFTFKQKIKTYLSKKRKKEIFIFFTWRDYLHKVTEQEFITSDYFKKIIELLNCDVLKNNDDITVNFKLHPNMLEYLDVFKKNITNERVSVKTSDDDLIIQDYILNSDIMITDYSSAALDFLIMKKPVIFYRFTKENNILLDSDSILFGTKVESFGDIENELIDWFDSKKEYEYMKTDLDKIYEYRDIHASKRLVRHIQKKVSGYKKIRE